MNVHCVEPLIKISYLARGSPIKSHLVTDARQKTFCVVRTFSSFPQTTHRQTSQHKVRVISPRVARAADVTQRRRQAVRQHGGLFKLGSAVIERASAGILDMARRVRINLITLSLSAISHFFLGRVSLRPKFFQMSYIYIQRTSRQYKCSRRGKPSRPAKCARSSGQASVCSAHPRAFYHRRKRAKSLKRRPRHRRKGTCGASYSFPPGAKLITGLLHRFRFKRQIKRKDFFLSSLCQPSGS
jgi:hypothetical protein